MRGENMRRQLEHESSPCKRNSGVPEDRCDQQPRNAAISVIRAAERSEQVTGSDLSGMLEAADCGDTRISNHLHCEAIIVNVTKRDSEPANARHVFLHISETAISNIGDENIVSIQPAGERCDIRHAFYESSILATRF